MASATWIFHREDGPLGRGEVAGFEILAGHGAIKGRGDARILHHRLRFRDGGGGHALTSLGLLELGEGDGPGVAERTEAGEIAVGLPEGGLGAGQSGVELPDIELGEQIARFHLPPGNGGHFEKAAGNLGGDLGRLARTDRADDFLEDRHFAPLDRLSRRHDRGERLGGVGHLLLPTSGEEEASQQD